MNRLQNEGYYGGVRLVMAICKVFFKYCKDNKIDLHKGNFTLSYDTNIPRQVQSFFFLKKKKKKDIGVLLALYPKFVSNNWSHFPKKGCTLDFLIIKMTYWRWNQ